MAIVKTSDGTQAATVNTEHTLLDQQGAGVYELEVDANALASGDTLELRVYTKVLSGGTQRQYLLATFTGAQAQPNLKSPPIVALNGAKFTLKQTAGTGRSFPWQVTTLG